MRFVDTSHVRSQFGLKVIARDGVELSADVYWPAAPGTYPVLVTLTPYDNNRTDGSQVPAPTTSPQVPSDRFKLYAEHGFIVVAADARGRGDSEGSFEPFVHEASDGADVVAWARTLSDSSGRVGLFGAGYSGFAALAVAGPGGADAVAAWSPFGTAGIAGLGGAARLDWLLWLHVVGGRRPQPADVPHWADIFSSRPIAQMHEKLGRPRAAWPTWLEHLAPGSTFWSPLDLDEQLASSTHPVLLVSGWWDVGLESTLQHWNALSTSPAEGRHRLVIGPWDSARTRRPAPLVGGFDWGPASVVDPDQTLIDWFTEHLVDHDLAIDWFTQRPIVRDTPARVRTFLTGRNDWLEAEAYGDGGTPTRWWLTSDGSANTRVGDGRLVDAVPPGNGADAFTHATTDAVPWQPSPTTFVRQDASRLTLDSSFITTRDDTLVYTTPAFTTPVTVTGRPAVQLWTQTDASDADWIVLLEDVFPGDGRSLCLTHGVKRLRTNGSVVEDAPTQVDLHLGAVHHELQPGHALRIVVVASLFPLYAVNLGGDAYTQDTHDGRYRQMVLHGLHHPSSVELQIERPDAPTRRKGSR
jgi:putative CocE/NonD family hydrolase